MKSIRVAVALAAGLLSTAAAQAGGVPDLTGTWKLADQAFAASRVGSGNKYFGTLPKPAFGTPDQAFVYKIDKQDGRAFYGTATGPNGKSEVEVGVIRFDNNTFIMSSDSGTVQGRILGKKIEICWTDALPNWNAVSCGLYKKVK